MWKKIKNFISGLFARIFPAGGGSGSSVPLEASCVAHYKMNDDVASTVVIDSRGYSNGTAQQNTEDLTVTGKVGGALSHNGVDDYENANDAFESVFQDSFAISAWFKPTEGQPSPGKDICGVSKVNEGTIGLWHQKTGGKGRIYADYYAGGNGTAIATDEVLSAGQEIWHHIVFIVKQTSPTQITLYLYLDNVLLDIVLGSETANAVMADYIGNYDLFIGQSSNAGVPSVGWYFYGSLDDIMIFNKAISVEEISFLYNSGHGIENFQLSGMKLSSAGEKLLSEVGV